MCITPCVVRGLEYACSEEIASSIVLALLSLYSPSFSLLFSLSLYSSLSPWPLTHPLFLLALLFLFLPRYVIVGRFPRRNLPIARVTYVVVFVFQQHSQ